MTNTATHEGHRARARERFLSGDPASRTDAALLELLLTYAIPQRDVQPLVKTLLSKFGTLDKILAASPADLCQVAGIKQNSATLLSLVSAIQKRNPLPAPASAPQLKPKSDPASVPGEQRVLAPILETPATPKPQPTAERHRKPVARRGSELFGKAVLKEAIAMLPKLGPELSVA
jgi:DNA repair protein RadC